MSQLSRSLPLARIHPLEEVPRVELYLDEPLTISQSSKRRRLGQQILALLHGIDLLVQKEEHSGLNLSDKIDAIVLELEELISKQSEKYKTAQEYVKFTGLATVFPRASSRLGIDVTTEEVSYNVQDHFSHMSLMNQVVSTALQLQKDIGISNHKYIAHQLALLYQSLNQAGGGFLKFKSKIETQFDKIKSLINESDTPQLNDEQKKWLMSLTSEVVTDGLFKRRPVRPTSQPLADFLNDVAK